jgi:hypothetical protein
VFVRGISNDNGSNPNEAFTKHNSSTLNVKHLNQAGRGEEKNGRNRWGEVSAKSNPKGTNKLKSAWPASGNGVPKVYATCINNNLNTSEIGGKPVAACKDSPKANKLQNHAISMAC